MVDDVISDFQNESKKTNDSFLEKLGTLRTGRANPALIENLLVDSYGTKMPLKSLASISVSEARVLLIQIWDRNNVKEIEKAILISNLGLSPQTDGNMIRVIIPPLTGEKREEYKKIARQEAENHRVIIRKHRKDGMEMIKMKKDEKELSEDEEKRAKEVLQKEVDLEIMKIDEILGNKLAELDEI